MEPYLDGLLDTIQRRFENLDLLGLLLWPNDTISSVNCERDFSTMNSNQ